MKQLGRGSESGICDEVETLDNVGSKSKANIGIRQKDFQLRHAEWRNLKI